MADCQDQTQAEAGHLISSESGISHTPKSYRLHEPFVDFWVNVGLGVFLRAGYMPYAIYIVQSLDRPPSSLFAASLPELIVGGAAHILLGLVLSFFATALVTGTVIAALVAFCMTMKRHHENPYAATLAAGLTALVVTVPATSVGPDAFDGCGWLVLGMVSAHTGSRSGIEKARPYTTRFRKRQPQLRTAKQFQVRDVLVTTAWTAAILAILKLSGGFNVKLAAISMVWLGTLLVLMFYMPGHISKAPSVPRETISET